jgi:hypothetical protein
VAQEKPNLDPFGAPEAQPGSPFAVPPSLDAGGQPGTPGTPAPAENSNVIAERKLAQRKEAQYLEIPLGDVLDDISQRYGVEFYIRRKSLEEAGMDPHLASTVNVNFQQVRGDMLLDLVLSESELVYMIRDGIIIVTTYDDLEANPEVRVYNCSDLISMSGASDSGQPAGGFGTMKPSGKGDRRAGGSGGGFGGGIEQPGTGTPARAMPGIPGMPGAAGGLMGEGEAGFGTFGGFGSSPRVPIPEATALVNVITSIVEPDLWEDAGGPGTVRAYYGGLLVVNNSLNVHRKIEKLLEMMREAARMQSGAVVRER